MLMQSSQIPQVLVPWVALLLILVCLFVLILVAMDIKKNGISMAHVGIFLPTLSTILVLGFGSAVVVTVMEGIRAAGEKAENAQNVAIAAGEKAENAQNIAFAAAEKAENAQEAEAFTRSLLPLGDSFADLAAFTRSMSLAQNEEDRKLAFRIHARQNPELAKTWLSNPQYRNLFANPADVAALQRQVDVAALQRQAEVAHFELLLERRVGALENLLQASSTPDKLQG